MLNKDFIQTGSQILLLIGELIVLIFCIAYIQHIYSSNILPDKYAKETYHQTNCFLVSKRLSGQGHIIHSYRADFLVSYNANGVQYNRWVSGNGLDQSFFQNEGDQEDILSQFDVGGTYPCYYDPQNPVSIILVQRHNWLSTFPLMVPSVIFVITFYYFLKNVFQLISNFSTKRREETEEEKKQQK